MGRRAAGGHQAEDPGDPEAAPSTGYVFEPTEENLGRWHRWRRFANIEQLSTLVLITFLSILFTSLLAYSTVFGRPDLPERPPWGSSTTPAGWPPTS